MNLAALYQSCLSHDITLLEQWQYLLDQRLASGRGDVLLHVLLAMTGCTVLLRREAWELAAACGYEHHRKHSACLPATECPVAQWSAQATNGNKSKAWVTTTGGWWMTWTYWTCTLTWRRRHKLCRYGGHKCLLTSSHSPSYIYILDTSTTTTQWPYFTHSVKKHNY